jgi:HSP20 family protein
MADIKVQNKSSERERNVARRSDYWPSRDVFGFSPFSLLRRLNDEMDRAFGSTFGLTRAMGESGLWCPTIEVRERNGNLEIDAELPGMNKEDVNVECTDEGITIQGERRQEREETEAGVRRSERSYGRFYRMIPLPEGAATDKAKAEFKDGLLRIRIPLPENRQRQAKQIPIES